MTSAMGRDDLHTVGGLRGVKVRMTVVAKSGGQATRTVTGRINVSQILDRILPRSGTGRIGGLRSRNGGMKVINSKVGSTPTLTRTSMKVTVNSNASMTVRSTSIILVQDSLVSMPATIRLDGSAVQGVGRGLF